MTAPAETLAIPKAARSQQLAITTEDVFRALALATQSTLLCVRNDATKIEIITSELTPADLADFRVIVPLNYYISQPPKSYKEGDLMRFAEEIARAMTEALATIGKGAILPLLRFKPMT